MKSITTYINEALKLGNKSRYKYHPETKEELHDLLNQLLEERGNEGYFNDIDTSKITDMSDLFYDYLTDFNGNISQWDVSNVTNMHGMFSNCANFNKDISNWDVSNVNKKYGIFKECAIEEKYKPKFK